MARNSNQRGRNNNNPEGHNQYTNSWTDTAKERPLATAAAVGGLAAAGAFLWSRRNQISDQLSSMSDQISEWSNSRRSESDSSDQFGARSTTSESGSSTFETASSSPSSTASRSTGGRTGRASAGQTASPARTPSTPIVS